MKFSTYPIADAAGVILAHSLQTPARTIKKGTRLGAEEVAEIRHAGRAEVIGARLEPGDVDEDAAAARVAAAARGAHARVADAFTGRSNLFAESAGVLMVDTVRLLALNRIDDGLTLATLNGFDRVTAGEMVATVKIIPFALPERVIVEAENLAAGGLIAIAPFQQRTGGLILTRLPQTKASVLRKRERVMAARLESAGSRLAAVEIVPHETAAVAGAIAAMSRQRLDPIIVFAASAIVDRGDVIPAALEAAGGRITHLGMPVDPGNLLMMGSLDGGDVIGAPSCAGSPKLNGFDWVLERRLAGLAVGRDEITAMAVGGLLKEIPSRPQPRAGDDGSG